MARNNDIENHHLIKYSDHLHNVYQGKGFFLKGMVRHDGITDGATVKFFINGKTVAGKKQRGGLVPGGTNERGSVKMDLERTYAKNNYEDFDQLVTNYDQNSSIVVPQAMALGRSHDAEIIASMDKLVPSDGGLQVVAWNKTKPLDSMDAILQAFDVSEVELGDTYVVLPQSAWAGLKRLPQFSSLDYIKESELPYTGVQAVKWNGLTVMKAPTSKLFNTKGGKIQAYAFDKTAVGYEGKADITTKTEYRIDYDDWTVSSMMDVATGVIDPAGVIRIEISV